MKIIILIITIVFATVVNPMLIKNKIIHHFDGGKGYVSEKDKVSILTYPSNGIFNIVMSESFPYTDMNIKYDPEQDEYVPYLPLHDKMITINYDHRNSVLNFDMLSDNRNITTKNKTKIGIN
jgi:hypothetical protein